MQVKWKVGVAFIAGLLSTAMALHPPATSQDWAAWVQAIGSIAAIAIAIWLPIRLKKQDQKAEVLKQAEGNHIQALSVYFLMVDVRLYFERMLALAHLPRKVGRDDFMVSDLMSRLNILEIRENHYIAAGQMFVARGDVIRTNSAMTMAHGPQDVALTDLEITDLKNRIATANTHCDLTHAHLGACEVMLNALKMK